MYTRYKCATCVHLYTCTLDTRWTLHAFMDLERWCHMYACANCDMYGSHTGRCCTIWALVLLPANMSLSPLSLLSHSLFQNHNKLHVYSLLSQAPKSTKVYVRASFMLLAIHNVHCYPGIPSLVREIFQANKVRMYTDIMSVLCCINWST